MADPSARADLRRRLLGSSSVEIVHECGGGAEALAACAELGPDLVFLDVQYPGRDRVDLARRIVGGGEPPPVVFVTTDERYAVDAFEVQALDYLLIPYSDARLQKTVERCRASLHRRQADNVTDRRSRLADAQMEDHTPQERYVRRLLIPERGRMRVVRSGEIRWIGGAKNYVEIHSEDGTYLYRQSMKLLEEALDPSRFARTHRSTIVCIDRVCEVVSRGGSRSAVLDDGTRLPISQSYAKGLMRRLEH